MIDSDINHTLYSMHYSLSVRLLAVIALCSLAFLSGTAQAATTQQASAFINQVGAETVGILTGVKDKSKKQSALSKIFDGNVDFPWVARFVMGRYWREATEGQKSRYVQEYQRFLVRHYAVLFSEYDGGSFNVTYARDDGDDEFSVGMQVQAGAQSSDKVLIDYKVRYAGGSFKIFDVVIEGVSMLTTQRSEFASIISNHDIDYLIDMLEKKANTPIVKKS